jgi:hypothetical protein
MARGGSVDVEDAIVAHQTAGPALEGMGDAMFAVRWSLTWANALETRGIADPWSQEGNMEADPRFVDRAAGDYRLAVDSPARDAGNPTRFDTDGTRSDLGATGGPTPR